MDPPKSVQYWPSGQFEVPKGPSTQIVDLYFGPEKHTITWALKGWFGSLFPHFAR